MKALVSELTRASIGGVSDGARTRDTQDHNLVLYQLSYTHHARGPGPGNGSKTTGDGQPSDAAGGGGASDPASPEASRSANDPTTSAAAACAASLFGPGAGTNSVRR